MLAFSQMPQAEAAVFKNRTKSLWVIWKTYTIFKRIIIFIEILYIYF